MIVRVLCAAKKRSLESRSSDCKSYNTHNSFTRFSSFPAFGTQCKMEVTAGISPLGQAQQSALLLRLQACIWIFHKVNSAKTGSRESRQGQDKKTAEARRRPHCGGGGGRHLCRNLVARVPPLPFHEIFSAAVALLLHAAQGEQVLACMETFLSRIDPRVLAQSQYSVYQLLTQYYSLLTGLAARKSRIVRESCYSQSIRYSSPMYHNEVETLMKSNCSLS